jgi:hypothetical protein
VSVVGRALLLAVLRESAAELLVLAGVAGLMLAAIVGFVLG